MSFKALKVEKLVSVDGLCHAVHNIHEPGYFYEGHSHDSWELVYVKKGQAVASADEEIFTLKEGQLLFHKPLSFHTVRNNGDTNLELLIIEVVLSGNAVNGLAKRRYNLTTNEFKDYYCAFVNLAEAGNHNRYELYEARNMFASKAAAELERFLLNLMAKAPINRRKTYEEEEYYKIISLVMQNNCEKNLTVEEIAELCNMSRSNLKRVFALYNNVGIAKHMLKLKLERAQELLEKGMSIQEVAERLGFSSSQYFQTVFKREVGITPNQYIKSHTNY
jgi:AraC-like DNA-binding protein